MEAKTAFDLSAGLGREDKLAIQARYLEAKHDWEGAIGIYRTLAQFFPDNLSTACCWHWHKIQQASPKMRWARSNN